MRVAIVAPLVAPLVDAQSYGSHAVLIDVARGLASRGHDVRVFAAAGSDVPGLHLEAIAIEPAVRAAFIVPGADGPNARSGDAGAPAPDGGAMRRAFEALFERLRAWRPDAVSGHAFDAEAIELEADLPVVHTLHLPPIVPAVVAAARASRVRFAAVSRVAQEAWTAAGVATELIPNGVPDFVGSAATLGAPPRDRAIVAGRISREKGTVTAIRVARRAGLRPLVVGSRYDREYAERDVEPLLGPDEQREPVSRAALARLMAAAAVTLMPVEWDEPFGLVAAESQMAGCPVVAFRRGALPDVVQDGVGGRLVEPGDEDGLVRAIGEVSRFDRASIRRDALERLALEPMIDRYERALAAVAAGEPIEARLV